MTVRLGAASDGVVRITESADAWSVASVLDGGRGQCLCVDPREPSRVFVGSHGRGPWRSAGARAGRRSLPKHDVSSVAVSPVDGAVYAGCEPSMLFRSRDGGANWEELS